MNPSHDIHVTVPLLLLPNCFPVQRKELLYGCDFESFVTLSAVNFDISLPLKYNTTSSYFLSVQH